MALVPITGTDLKSALTPYLLGSVLPPAAGQCVDDAFLYPYGLMAFTHRSLEAEDNQDMPALIGDSLGKTAIMLRYVAEYPEKRGRHAVHRVAEAVMSNATLERMLYMLGLHNRMLYGRSYQHASKARSKHGQGTVMEALLYAFYKRYDVETCFRFFNGVLDEYLQREQLTLCTIELPNAVGRLNELLAQHGGLADRHVEYQIEQKGPQLFVGSASVAGAPTIYRVVALCGQTKQETKKKLATALLSDEGLVAWIESDVGGGG